jgi:LytS/YehU family sensor histidine kinase
MAFVAMHEQSVKEVAARSEAQLRLLRAQLEPHMLFNTLATLRSLVDDDPKQAQTMIDQIIAYLRGALAASRVEATTLRSEFDQLHAYLQIMSLRMGPRLTYTLDLPNLLQVQAISSMLLQPLVENAIKHGVEPKVGDGWVGVVAKRTDQGLEISVTDSGVGLPPGGEVAPGGEAAKATSGSYGMLHVRERLKAVYGPAATLTLAALEPQGVRATVRIPQ